MTAPRSDAAKARQPSLVSTTEGVLRAVWPQSCYRFLLDNGSTLDVLTTRDDSDLRAAVVERSGCAIAGYAVLPVDQARPPT